jgi:tetratricopeptide (TPR) repeat protein
MAARKNPSLLFEDAKLALEEAKTRGETGPGWSAVMAQLLVHDGKLAEAGEHAARATAAALKDAGSRESAQILWIVGASAAARIAKANAESKEWPAEWLADANAAFVALSAHPLATPERLCQQYDLLVSVGAPEAARAALDATARRFPESAPVHERLRAAILEESGVEGLEEAYAKMRAGDPKSGAFCWYSGYASFVTAEFHKRAGDDKNATAAYGRAIQQFDESVAKNAGYSETANYYVSLALAGRARVELEEQKLDEAVADLAAAIERTPTIFEAEDGLGRTPIITIRALRWVLDDKKRADLREKLESAIEAADPELASRPAK